MCPIFFGFSKVKFSKNSITLHCITWHSITLHCIHLAASFIKPSYNMSKNWSFMKVGEPEGLQDNGRTQRGSRTVGEPESGDIDLLVDWVVCISFPPHFKRCCNRGLMEHKTLAERMQPKKVTFQFQMFMREKMQCCFVLSLLMVLLFHYAFPRFKVTLLSATYTWLTQTVARWDDGNCDKCDYYCTGCSHSIRQSSGNDRNNAILSIVWMECKSETIQMPWIDRWYSKWTDDSILFQKKVE